MQHPIINEHLVKVPLDYNQPHGQHIEVFARELYLAKNKNSPTFVFLQGGPGFAAPRQSLAWINELVKQFRLILLDQRGTGRSHKVGPELCATITDPHQLADYLSHFGTHNIVNDLEYLRHHVFKRHRWLLLGQSYGGFLATHYLSRFPRAVQGVIICGGLPPITASSVDAVYQRLVTAIYQRNQKFYRRYPHVKDKVKRIAELLTHQPVTLYRNNYFTVQRLLDSGLILGTTNGLQTLYNILDDPFVDSSQRHISFAFAKHLSDLLHYETNPIYVLLHEAIYCDNSASNWAAERQLAAHGGFGLDKNPICFYGETMRKHMLRDYPALRGFRQAAALLAHRQWPALYNQSALARNSVPIECIVYRQDYYVDYRYSLATLDVIGNSHAWVHPHWQHDSLRHRGGVIVQQLGRKRPRLFPGISSPTRETRATATQGEVLPSPWETPAPLTRGQAPKISINQSFAGAY